MNSGSLTPPSVFSLSSKVQVLPIIHGSGDMASMVREVMVSNPLDCLALPLPPSVEEPLEQAVKELPAISVVLLPEEQEDEEEQCSFVPVDPCQPVVMGIRVGMNEGITRAYVDREVARYEPTPWTGPDPYTLKSVSLATFAAATIPFLPQPTTDGARWKRICWMAFRLHELELDFQTILFLCPMSDWPWLRQAYQERLPFDPPEKRQGFPNCWKVDPETLYFVLGELPFVTQLYEQRRAEARSDSQLSIDGVKELLLEARSRWMEARPASIIQEANWVTPQLLQRYFQYVRNLTLMDRRLTPDLYTLVQAAQQMAGDEFALVLLDTAKSYRYQTEDVISATTPGVRMGMGALQDPDGGLLQATNRLEGPPLVWRNITLRPKPTPPQKRAWTYQWNPFGQCSWPPEDERIESFASHVRQQSRQVLGADLARIEKFSTSLEDGIDVRGTLRQWTSSSSRSLSDIHVKVIPPARGTIEVIVFFFEVPADPEKFSWRTTWYAEHQEESTLSFFATPFSTNMIGPGIGEACYGGALFLFPPRLIPDIWENPMFDFATTLEERLLAGACAHSQETHVAVVSPVPLKAEWRKIAHRFRRKLVPIPLHRFSGQTIARLRKFHVLNGHDIRSYASRFIRE